MILDVGANVGDYARLVLVNSTSAVVYCFKPLPEVFDKLAGGGGLRNEPRVHLYQCALAAENGECTFYFDPCSVGNTTALADVQTGVHGLLEVDQGEGSTSNAGLFLRAVQYNSRRSPRD